MGGLLIHLPKGVAISQLSITQGFQISGVRRVLEQHHVNAVVVLTGLFLTSRIRAWILVLQQRKGSQVKMVCATC